MLTWARFAGSDVPEIKLLTGDQLEGLPPGLIKPEELAFGVRRFDREAVKRVHQEDLAQVREVSPEHKYENATYSGIGRIIHSICPEDFTEYVRRLAAIVVIGNIDAHLKNWTIRYPDGRTTRLSPAYDFVSVSAYEDFRNQELAFAINGGRAADSVSYGNFKRLAERVGVDSDLVVTTVRQTVELLVASWPQVKLECPVPNFVSQHIEDRIRRLPLVIYEP
jgi:serine/threonine protein kinase HipA of HipAB toxin-antitoxin module